MKRKAKGGRKVRKLSEARASKVLREMKKREPHDIEYCDLRQRTERQELEDLLAVERKAVPRGG